MATPATYSWWPNEPVRRLPPERPGETRTNLCSKAKTIREDLGCAEPARVLHCLTVTLPGRADAPSPTWRGWRQAVLVVVWPPNLKKTVVTALVVGTILFAINQLNVVLDGDATPAVWVKAGVTYLVPFAVSNVGILIATHRR